MSSKKIWGLTGGIASGKSTAARLFAEEGIPVIDADQISRSLSQPGGAAHDTILKEFGTTDRAKLRQIVFNDQKAKKKLEEILHPLIRTESVKQMKAAHGDLVIYEAALLIETGRHKDFHGLIVIDLPRELRKKRLMERDALSDQEAENILNSQINDAERRKHATILLDNSGTQSELKEKIKKLAQDLKRK